MSLGKFVFLTVGQYHFFHTVDFIELSKKTLHFLFLRIGLFVLHCEAEPVILLFLETKGIYKHIIEVRKEILDKKYYIMTTQTFCILCIFSSCYYIELQCCAASRNHSTKVIVITGHA